MLVPLNLVTMRHELGLYAAWYGDWPSEASCASPQTAVRGQHGATVAVVISCVEGRRRLPVIELREAA